MLDELKIERERKFAWDATHDALREALLGCDDPGALLRAERGSHHFLARHQRLRRSFTGFRVSLKKFLLRSQSPQGSSDEWHNHLRVSSKSNSLLIVLSGSCRLGSHSKGSSTESTTLLKSLNFELWSVASARAYHQRLRRSFIGFHPCS